MLSAGFILLLSAAYLGLLFAVARFGDARADAGRSIITANVCALSLAVYCTSWTFYGSVGRATAGGLEVALSASYALSQHFFARLSAAYQRTYFDFRSRPGDERAAGGATDQYLTAAVGMGVNL